MKTVLFGEAKGFEANGAKGDPMPQMLNQG